MLVDIYFFRWFVRFFCREAEEVGRVPGAGLLVFRDFGRNEHIAHAWIDFVEAAWILDRRENALILQARQLFLNGVALLIFAFEPKAEGAREDARCTREGERHVTRICRRFEVVERARIFLLDERALGDAHLVLLERDGHWARAEVADAHIIARRIGFLGNREAIEVRVDAHILIEVVGVELHRLIEPAAGRRQFERVAFSAFVRLGCVAFEPEEGFFLVRIDGLIFFIVSEEEPTTEGRLVARIEDWNHGRGAPGVIFPIGFFIED